MKEIRLLSLELTNYRNIEHEVYVFGGNNSKIVGENRIGKTNTLEAIYFLLSNYLLDGSSDLTNLKPLSDTTKEVRVEGTFEIFDNKTPQVPPREIKLSKTYGEKWVKQRGTNELTMQGHYEEYYVNGIKQSKEKDYQELLQEYFGVRNDEKGEIDPIQMLINPLYLGNIGDSKDWQKLRTFIVKLIGDVNDDEVFAKAPETMVIKQDLLNALGKTEQLKKMYSNDIDTLNNQLLGFDSQVELLEKTDKPSDDEVANAKAKLEAINTQIVEMKNDSGKDSVVDQLEREIVEVSKQIVAKNQDEYSEFLNNNKNDDEVNNRKQVYELNEKISQYVSVLNDSQLKRGSLESQIRAKTFEKDNFANEYIKVDKEIKNIDNSIVLECPTCHRPFSEDEVNEKKETMLKELNAKKDGIVIKGKQLKEEIETLNKEVEGMVGKEKAIKDEISKSKDTLAILTSHTFERPIFKESEELVKLRAKEQDLKEQLTKRKSIVSEQATNQYERLEQLERERINAQKVIDDRTYYDRQMDLLKNVELERTNVSNKLIDTEQKREALKTYIYTKLRLLDEHIAKVFGKLRFQLIKENINGGFDPVCKPYIYDIDKDESTNVLWKNGSKSEKIITGITIVEAIRNELDLSQLPFLFDEGGEISNETLKTKFKTNAQIICVRVEDNILKPIIVKF